ncbi:MAG TPA: winged helix-turn-helix domain-containing protein [Candidatus Limnocylindrales bacterium]|nr:winged helix-turn-helix domain-containing protein [Candidatus Limnocylindrales bacterium]
MEGNFQLGEWLICPQLNTVQNGANTVRLEHKFMQVLLCLASRPGEVISKDELIRTVWPDTFVTDDVLTRAVSELRRILKDDAKHPRFIETISKNGYRLIPPIQPLALAPTTQDSRRWPRAALLSLVVALLVSAALVVFPARHRQNQVLQFFSRDHQRSGTAAARSIAVLPLENLSGDPSQEYFADGMTDELITNLAKIESLRVISRTSVMQYKQARKPLPEIARALNVELIVTGTVSRSGDQVRITAQLVDGKRDIHLWAQDFERDLRNVLNLESEIAQAIAREIRVELTREDASRLVASPSVNMKAHDAYLRGRYQWNMRTGESLRESIKLYEQAIASDPEYALAYAGKADSYILLEELDQLSPAEANPLISTAARKAVEADPNLADAHMVLAGSKETDWDWAGAELEYKRAIELNPGLARAHHWYSLLLVNTSRPDEAIAEIQRAVDLDPLTDRLYAIEAETYYYARRYDRAEQALGMIEGPATNRIHVHSLSGQIGVARKDYPAAITEFLTTTKLEPDDPQNWALLVYAYAQGGKLKEASASLAKLQQLGGRRYVNPFWMALAWTGLRDQDNAIHFLNEACRLRSSRLATVHADPLFDPLRSDPRFQALLHKIALPTESADHSATK